MSTPWRYLSQLVCASMLGVLFGCHGTVDSFVRNIPYIGDDSGWIIETIKEHDEDCLVTIYTDPHWNRVSLKLRYCKEGILVCDWRTKGSGATWKQSDFWNRRLYAIDDPNALAVFHNLYNLASIGYKCNMNNGLMDSANGGVYVITTGRVTSLTVDESSALPCIATLESLAEEWDEILQLKSLAEEEGEVFEMGKRIASVDISAARRNLSDDIYASFSQMLTLAIERFDTICAVISTSAE